MPSDEGVMELKGLMKALSERGAISVLVEGGGVLIGHLYDEGLVDKTIVFIGPMIIGGNKATAAVGGIGVEKVAEALRLERIEVQRLGEDVVISGYVKRSD